MAADALTLTGFLAALKAAGEATRLRILHLLSLGELSVKDLTAILGQSQPRISRHLKLLDEAGLIARHREGNWVYCRHAENGAAATLAEVILSRIPAEESVFASDRARLDALRRDRSAAAERFFDALAHEWDRVRALQIGEGEVEGALGRLTDGRHYQLMLDLGTGTGRMLELFADRVDQCVGIDLSHTMLANARARLEAAGLANCQVRHGDITSLGQDAGVADLVVLHQVLHYFDDPLPVLREACRVLAPGGDFLIIDFAPHSVEFLRDEHAHRRLGFSREQVENWLAEADVELVDGVDLERAGARDEGGLTVSVWLARRAEVDVGGGRSTRKAAA